MKPVSIGPFASGALGLAAAGLLVLGMPHDRQFAAAAATAPKPSRVSAGGFSLNSAAIDLPADAAGFPDGPNADAINANCVACHSASMALSQPVLSRDQWKAIVTKMRDVYKAPVAEEDVPAILEYLDGVSARVSAARPRT